MASPADNANFPFIFVPVVQQSPMELEMQPMHNMQGMQPMQPMHAMQPPPTFYMIDPRVYYGQQTVVEPSQVVEDPTLSESDCEDNDFLIPKPTQTPKLTQTYTQPSCQYLRCALLLSIIAAYVSVLVVLPYIPGDWSAWKQATCMPDHCFCEEPRPNLLRQPTNTWTNIAFTIYGVYLLLKIWAFQVPQYSGVATFYTMIYAISLTFIGITSGWYHASLTFLGQWFDDMGMFLLASWCFSYNFTRLKVIGRWGFLLAYLVLNTSAGFASYEWPETRRYVFAGMIVAYLLSTWYANHKLKPTIQSRYIWLAILSFAVAFTFWILDLKHILCFPTSVFQGHGVWHILTATSAYLVYKYYTTEHPSSSSSSMDMDV